MAKFPTNGFKRPPARNNDETEAAMDEMFEREAANESGASKIKEEPVEGSDRSSSTEIKSSKEAELSETHDAQRIDQNSRVAVSQIKTEVQPSGFDINSILSEEVEPEGFVKRNFSIKRTHMNRIKELTVKANNRGHRTTQDDIINSIFDDFFKNKKI